MELLNENIFTFENKKKSFLYDGSTGLFAESSKLLNVALKLVGEKGKNEIIDELMLKYDKDDIETQLNYIEELLDKGYFRNKKGPDNLLVTEKEWLNSEVLINLWLNISHDCNLRCIYCYGQGGDYGNKRIIMKKEIAKECIDFWYKYLDKSRKNVSVIIFGGEPLINKDVLIYCVNYINNIVNDIVISYSMTTNGTIMDDELIKLFRDNNFNITLSMDGGEIIQNKNRPYATGKGSFEKVSETLKKLGSIYDVTLARMTLTHENVPYLQKSVEDLWAIGFNEVQYDLVCTVNEKLKITENDLNLIFSQVKKLNDITYENVKNGKWKVLRNITKVTNMIHKNPKGLNDCSLFSAHTVMFTPEGEIYKCQRLVGQKDYCSGTLVDGIDWVKFNETFTRKEIDKCNHCFAKRMCYGGCAQVNLVNNNNIYEPSEIWCKHMKFILEEAFRLYTNLYVQERELFMASFK